MKKIITILAVILYSTISSGIFSQTYQGIFRELYFGRQPSAKAEAMGRGFSAVTGDALTYYYNPAGMASLNGLNINGSYAQPYYNFDTASYNFFGASYKIKKYGTVGLSRDYFDYGFDYTVIRTDEYGNIIGTETVEPKVAVYRLTLASEVIKNLFVGANFNLFHPNLFGDNSILVGNEQSATESDIFYFDLGVIKSFDIKSKKVEHRINLGTSLINVNSAEYSLLDNDQGEKLPVIFKIGASYNLSIEDKKFSSKLKSFDLLVNIEYEDLFNSQYFGGFHGGMDLTFLEILSLRAGHFTMKYDPFYADSSSYTVSDFTYGFGVNIPIRQLTNSKTPIEIKFDYVNLMQPQYNLYKSDWSNFQVYTFTFNWIF